MSSDLERRRRLGAETLIEHLASEHLSVEEFEARMDEMRGAEGAAEVRDALAGLPGREPGARRPGRMIEWARSATEREPRRSRNVADHDVVIAVGGGVVREGAWRPPRVLWVVGGPGGGVLDFREARLPDGVTEVRALGAVGDVELLIPPGLALEEEGDGGGEVVGTPGGSRLRLRSLSVLARVRVRVEAPVGGPVRRDGSRE